MRSEPRDRAYLEDYERWVFFYSDLLWSLSEGEVKELMAADAVSPHRKLIRSNSLLRILDKVFFMDDNGVLYDC